jgi:hypothetical protein
MPTNNTSLGARAFEAFGAMLRVNPIIDLDFPGRCAKGH